MTTKYTLATHGNSSQSAKYGNHILQPGMGEIRKPTWNGTQTVVRFLPQWDFEEHRWTPFRTSPEPMRFGDWIRRYEAVRGFGSEGMTFLLYDPTDRTYDVRSNPCVRLFNNISKSIDNATCEPDWPQLFKGGQGRKATLTRPQPIYLARAGIFKINSKDLVVDSRAPLGLSSNDPAYFMELPRSAGEKLINLLEEKNEDYKGDMDEYHLAYKYGDIVSLEHGAYVSIFEEGTNQDNQQSAADNAPRQLSFTTGGRGNYGNNGGGTKFKGYDVRIESTYKGFSAALNTPAHEKIIKDKQRPWEECLQFLTHQQQAFLVQDGFPPKAILYAWKDNPEWIKDETRRKAVGRITVAMDPRDNAQAQVVTNDYRAAAQPPKQTPMAADASTVGGWGDSAWGNDTGSDESGNDMTIPKASGVDALVVSMPGGASATVKPSADEEARRAAIMSGLEAAKKRASASKDAAQK
jgi:hypothetical protein